MYIVLFKLPPGRSFLSQGKSSEQMADILFSLSLEGFTGSFDCSVTYIILLMGSSLFSTLRTFFPFFTPSLVLPTPLTRRALYIFFLSFLLCTKVACSSLPFFFFRLFQEKSRDSPRIFPFSPLFSSRLSLEEGFLLRATYDRLK